MFGGGLAGHTANLFDLPAGLLSSLTKQTPGNNPNPLKGT